MSRLFVWIETGAILATLVATDEWVVAAEAPQGPMKLDSGAVMFYPPADAAQWPQWRASLLDWRKETRQQLAYDDALYRNPAFAWSQRNFNCAFVMLWDETFWDRRAGRFRVEEFLDDGQWRFGGYDSIVLWHAYPRIGFDERNQFDFYRDMPGGLAGLRDLSRRLHARGVKVFIDYNPWDTGTRREHAEMGTGSEPSAAGTASAVGREVPVPISEADKPPPPAVGRRSGSA